MDFDIADLFRDIRHLCDHARVNLDLSNDVYKSDKVLFSLLWSIKITISKNCDFLIFLVWF